MKNKIQVGQSCFSVLMSVYINDEAKYLNQALNSVIKQSVVPDQIVLVEDGPLSDDLYSVILWYQKKYPKLFTVVKNKENVGLGLALAEGLKHCNNNLVARMDSDDISVPDRFEKQIECFSKIQELDIVGGQIEEFIGNESNIFGKREVPLTNIEIKEYMKKRCPLNHMTVMFKKESVLMSGNYQDWHYDEDYYLWIRMALNDCVFFNLPEALVYARVGEEMYKRRGGLKYFKSEIKLQKYMLNNNMISVFRYINNCIERFIIQLVLPDGVRGYFFRKFARKRSI